MNVIDIKCFPFLRNKNRSYKISFYHLTMVFRKSDLGSEIETFTTWIKYISDNLKESEQLLL